MGDRGSGFLPSSGVRAHYRGGRESRNIRLRRCAAGSEASEKSRNGIGPQAPRPGGGAAAIVIRTNQILNGGSGMHPDIIDGLVAAVASQNLPTVHARGAIGTGDLSAFSEIAMGLIGESPLRDGRTGIGWTPHHGDALPFISTNAMTVAIAGDTSIEVAGWLQHCLVVSVLSVLASRSSVEPFAAQVQSARMHFGQAEVARAGSRSAGTTRHHTRESSGLVRVSRPTANLGCHLASGASTAEHAEYRDEFVFGRIRWCRSKTTWCFTTEISTQCQ